MQRLQVLEDLRSKKEVVRCSDRWSDHHRDYQWRHPSLRSWCRCVEQLGQFILFCHQKEARNSAHTDREHRRPKHLLLIVQSLRCLFQSLGARAWNLSRQGLKSELLPYLCTFQVQAWQVPQLYFHPLLLWLHPSRLHIGYLSDSLCCLSHKVERSFCRGTLKAYLSKFRHHSSLRHHLLRRSGVD